MSLERISCQSCGSSTFVHDEDGNLICSFCNTKFSSPREEILCAACGTENPPEAQRCMQCGLMLGKACSVCNHVNRPGVDHCANCASPLDVLEAVFHRARTQGRQTGLTKEQLVESKRSDMVYMAEQRQKLQEEERARQARLAVQREAALKQQRTMIIIVLGGIGLMAILAVILMVVFSSGGG